MKLFTKISIGLISLFLILVIVLLFINNCYINIKYIEFIIAILTAIPYFIFLYFIYSLEKQNIKYGESELNNKYKSITITNDFLFSQLTNIILDIYNLTISKNPENIKKYKELHSPNNFLKYFINNPIETSTQWNIVSNDLKKWGVLKLKENGDIDNIAYIICQDVLRDLFNTLNGKKPCGLFYIEHLLYIVNYNKEDKITIGKGYNTLYYIKIEPGKTYFETIYILFKRDFSDIKWNTYKKINSEINNIQNIYNDSHSNAIIGRESNFAIMAYLINKASKKVNIDIDIIYGLCLGYSENHIFTYIYSQYQMYVKNTEYSDYITDIYSNLNNYINYKIDNNKKNINNYINNWELNFTKFKNHFDFNEDLNIKQNLLI